MSKVFSFFVSALLALFVTVTAQAQTDSIVSASVQATLVNDSTYLVKGNLQLVTGWHIYGNNPDGLNAPAFQFKLETVKPVGAIAFSISSVKQKDVLFAKANVFLKSLDITQSIQIKGFNQIA